MGLYGLRMMISFIALLFVAPSVNAFAPKARRLSVWTRHLPTTARVWMTASSIPDLDSMTSPPTDGAEDSLEKLWNEQVTRELEASQLYLAASIWCDQRELVGMARYMREESKEERGHALAFIDFANKRDIPIVLDELEAPNSAWKDPVELWQAMLDSERVNTQALLRVHNVAQQSNDHAATSFLNPYHMEQVDSEDGIKTILARVTDENKTPGLLRQLDQELGTDKPQPSS